MSEIAEIVGQEIRQLRKARGLSLERLAELADMSITFLGEIERGRKDPSLKTLRKLSQAMGIPVREFIVGLDDDADRTAVSKHEVLLRLQLLLKDRYSPGQADAIWAFVEQVDGHPE